MRTALLYGNCRFLMAPVPALLSRAGFDVSVVSSDEKLKEHPCVKHFFHAKAVRDVALIVLDQLRNSYDLVIPCDEACGKVILNSYLSVSEKLKLLPVIDDYYFSHLYSKIGLSIFFQKYGIRTPLFLVANNHAEAVKAAYTLGFPVLLKIDYSAGGRGVFECTSLKSLSILNQLPFPILVQKKIDGKIISGGALFLQTSLIYFECGECMLADPHPRGPTIIKRYHPEIHENPLLQKEIIALGKILGANGFVNFTAIQTEGNERYYFEADMRPNKWIDYGKHYAEDASTAIKKYFDCGEIFSPADGFQSLEKECRESLFVKFSPEF